ncbi:MAG: phospholipase D family protein [Bacteroides sp.]|nr:phospholipase D family protein [Bacteroides sp.]MCM1413285.1 phospholipase D family protein [Bacteroides sp.]MCM1471405.1 phospholipase D family protein [Bacteroides sp.]
MNDVVYNEIVATSGYELVYAVGTTYSLDVEAFMAIALSFARLGEFTEADLQTPHRLLEGVRKANDRIALFCNRGGVTPPARKNALSAMLDKSVFEVADDSQGHELANFHPKIWVIKERNIEHPEQRQIKLIVLSRNLTKDTSLDIAASLSAQLNGGSSELRRKHAPLKELLMRLADKAGLKRKMVRNLANDIDSLGEFKFQQPFVDYDFLPIYFGENLNHYIDLRKSIPAERMMVVSPFIDYDTLDWLNKYQPNEEKVLITRLDSLTPEIMKLYDRRKAEVWTMSPVAEQNDVQPMNLHAKMYYSWRPKTGGFHLWLGSANATHSGFYRNSEFLLRLTYKSGKDLFKKFKDEFCDESKQLCQKIDTLPDCEPTKVDHSISRAVRTWLISHGNLSAEVSKTDAGYDVTVSAKLFKDIDAEVTIAPLQLPENRITLSPAMKSGTIQVINKSDLSEFYILSAMPNNEGIEPVKMVIKIPTKGIPADRDDSIFRSIIDTRDKFLQYVEMMITDRPQEMTAMMMQQLEGALRSHNECTAKTTALYESLLRIAASNPEKLSDIQDLVSKMAEGIVPKSFERMCKTFKKTIKKLKGYGSL